MKQLLILIMVVVTMAGCQNNTSTKSADKQTENISLAAAGATFPMPFYNMAFKQYSEKNGVPVSYGGIGSGGGIRSIKDKVVDFGASDAFLSDTDMADMPAPVVHIPTCSGAVVIAFNLEGINSIKLTPEVLTQIFMGKITQWNNPELQKLNPEFLLPDAGIKVVHRSDGSGTTSIFSDYMSKISPEWKEQIGTGKSLNWPVGMGAKGNPGVAGTINQTIGSIGYIGSEYAFAQKISFALLQNQSGNFIEPSLESVSAAGNGEIPADTRVMLTNSSDPNAYPICGFTWLILYKDQNFNNRSEAQARETLNLLNWMLLPEAQAVAQQVNYAPLPEKVVNLAQEILKTVTYNGKPLK
jgi:phosphate transport system substrate-binding protein